MSWLSRVANVFRSSGVDRALDEEIQFHLESRTDDLVAAGMTRESAHAIASRQFGNRLRMREYSRDVKLVPWLESLFRDAWFAVRILRKNVVVTGAVVASLSLAIGACLAAFSLVDALILRPLPVRDPHRLIYLTFPTDSDASATGPRTFSHPLFVRLRDAAASEIELFALGEDDRRRATFRNAQQDQEVRAQFVSGNVFPVLGVQPILGRLLAPSDDLSPGAHPVAVVSHAFWRRQFGGDPSIVGSTFTLGDRRLEIVGVAQESFTGIEPGQLIDMWVPIAMYDARGFTFSNREWNSWWVLGRLNPGVNAERARDVLQAPFGGFRRELTAGWRGPEHTPDRIERYVNTPLALHSAANGPSGIRYQFERPLWMLCILVGLVLLIAASNIANLFLARTAAREREMSLRLSIGATRARLVQQVLIEGALVTAVACLLGVVFARVAGPTVVQMLAPPTSPIYLDLRIDWRLLGFLCLTGALVSILFALVPALRASRVAPIGPVQGGNARLSSGVVLPRPLVAIQVGFSVAMLFVAALLLSSFARLVSVDPGFATSSVLLATIDSRRLQDPELVRTAGLQLVERVRSVPGVASASLSAWPLFSRGGWISRVRVPGQQPDPVSPPHLPISHGFFETMRIRMLQGRDFDPRDSEPADPTAVIVSDAFVRRYLGGGPAVGRVYERTGQPPPVRQEIIGVVADIRQDLRSVAPPMVYVPLRGVGTLEVRTPGDPLALRPVIEREVRAAHPSLRTTAFSLQSTRIANTLIRERLLALLSGFFAAIGLLLAAVGLYGVLNYSVVRRTREIGIRTALGAKPGALVRTVMRDAALMTGIGIVVGLAGGVYLSRLVRTLLYEIHPTDASSIALSIGCLLLAASLAALPAARRTVRLDPVTALRLE